MLRVFFRGRGAFAPYRGTCLKTSPAGATAAAASSPLPPPNRPPRTPLKPVESKSAKLKSTAQGVMSVIPTCAAIVSTRKYMEARMREGEVEGNEGERAVVREGGGAGQYNTSGERIISGAVPCRAWKQTGRYISLFFAYSSFFPLLFPGKFVEVGVCAQP